MTAQALVIRQGHPRQAGGEVLQGGGDPGQDLAQGGGPAFEHRQGFPAIALCVVFGFAFEWVFVLAGLAAANAQAAQGISFTVLPLTFVSSACVPVATTPGWLQAFAAHQPITHRVGAVRALTLGPAAPAVLGHPAGYRVTGSLPWPAAIVAVAAPLAVARYRRG